MKISRDPLVFAARSDAVSARAGRRPSRAAGFTLIEVLIALIVLVLGVLGAAGMTLASMRDSKQSGLRSQASGLAYELGDIMRANPSIYSVATPTTPSVLQVDTEAIFRGSVPGFVSSCWTSGCSPSDAAKNDLAEWYAKLTGPSGLPNASYVVCHDATQLNAMTCDNVATAPLVIKLQWDEKNNQARGQTTGPNAVAVTQRQLSIVVRPSL